MTADGTAAGVKLLSEILGVLRLLCLVELLEDKLARGSRTVKKLCRFLLCEGKLALGGSELFFVFFLGIRLKALVLRSELRRLIALTFKLKPCFLKSLDYILKPPVVGTDNSLRTCDDIFRQSELFGYRESVRFSGCTDNEFIGRLQSFDVEFA